MMAPRIMVAVVYAFIALAVCPMIFSAPTTKQTCAPVCNGRRQSVLKYEEGKTYIYNFDTEVITQLVGSTDESNRIKVKGQAALAAQSSCDFVLTIQQIAITSSTGQAISRVSDIEGSSIRFAYSDGVVDSVCVSDEDPTWSANIKRAIVSMLGNRALNGDTETIETDINGKCKTTYEVDGNKYTKTKDLHGCTNRDGGMASIYGVPYTAPSKYHSVPLFNSVFTCVQDLGKGIIQNVECTEGHSLDVIQTSGVRTDIKSTLHLANVQSSIVKGHDTNKKSSLMYDFAEVDDVQRQKASASNAVDLLNKICKEVEDGTVSLKVPGLFLQLRKAVRYARKDDLKLVYQQITSGKLCQNAEDQLGKLYLDAAAMSAGDGPIAFLAEVLASGQGQDSTKDIFIAYTTFASHPGPQTLQAVEGLVSKSDADPQYLLTASGLAHQYCQLTNPDCGSNDQYTSLVDTISQHVRVESEEEQVERVIVALQSLGNLNHLTPGAVRAVVNLLEDSSTIERLRVRALDAFRRDPCQETLKKKAEKIFSDVQQSTQVRIQAYLTFSKCLVLEDVPVVQAVIDNDEESNQVGSFVVSHIFNVLESSSPGKLGLKKVFGQVTLRDFPTDIRKFSRNFEVSAFDPNLMNSGISVDSNLIFSQDSFIPRCSNTNFTVDAFGRSYNLMELGLCVQDFEYLIERILGPTSALRSVTLDDIIKESADKLSTLKSSISNRFRREAPSGIDDNELDAIRNEVDLSERTGHNAHGDVYARVLGTTIVADTISQSGLKKQALGARITRAMEKLARGVQDQKFDITEPFTFLDDEIIIPTSSGLPINVQTEGTSVFSLQMTGNFDIASLVRGNNGDMRAKIMPSAATVIKAKMVLGNGPIESGLQIEGKIHSAAGIDLKVVREGGKFELRANIPQERIQIVDIRSDIYWVEQSMDQLEKKTTVKTKLASKAMIDNQCTSTFVRTLGLKVCSDVKIPQTTSAAPIFFLNGPSVVSLSVEKAETSMEGYYVKVENIKDQDTYGLDFVVDTPGSRTNRKISAQARAISPFSTTPQYTLKVESPVSNVEVKYKRSYTDDLKGAEVQVKIDEELYIGTAEMRKTPQGAGYKLVPVIQYQLPQGRPVKLLEGEITRVPGQELSVNLKTGGPFRSLRGSVKGMLTIRESDEDSCEVEYKDVEFASETAGKILLGGFYKRHAKVVDFKLDSHYGRNAEHALSIDATGGAPSPKERMLKVTTRSSRRELLNFDLDWSLKKDDNELKHKLEYTRGVAEPKVVIKQKSEIKIVSRKEFDVESELKVKHPEYNIDFQIEAEAKSIPGQERHAKLEVEAGDALKAKASYEASGDGLANYKFLGNLVFADKTYEVSEVSTKVDSSKTKYKSRLSVQPGFYYEADTDVYFKMENDEFKTDLTTVVTSDQLDHPVTLKSVVVSRKEGYGALLKLDAQGKKFLDLETNHKITRSSASKAYTTDMKVYVLNIFDAKLSNTYSAGEGDFVLDAHLMKSGRKIAATSKINKLSGDQYDWKADFKWDAARDPTQAITLKSLTTLAIAELRLDSKNDITVIGKNAQVNLRGSLSRDLLNGESTAEFDYTSPAGKSYSFASKLDLENQRTDRAAKLYLKVSRPDVQPSDLEVSVRGSNIDERECTFDIKTDIKANYRGQKDLRILGEVSSTHPGNYRSYAGSLSAEGSAIPKPIAMSLKADVKKGHVALKGDAKKGLEGPVQASLDATFDFDFWSPKKTLGVKYAITTPFDRIQSLEGESQGAYLYNSLKNFELSQESSVALNGDSPFSTSYLLRVLENEAKYSYKLISQGKPFITIDADGKLDRRHLVASIASEVRGSKSALKLDVNHQLPTLSVKLTGDSDLLATQANNFEFKLSNARNSDGTYDSEFMIISGGEDRLSITNKLEVSPKRKSIETHVAVGDDSVKTLRLLFNEAQKDKWNVEAYAKWGEEGKHLSTKGSLTKVGGAFDGELSLDCPYYEANKFSVKVSKKVVGGGRHGIDISVDGNNKRALAIGLEYAIKDDSDEDRSLDGTVKIEGKAAGMGVDVSGKFNLEDTTLNRLRHNGEEGRRVRASVEVKLDNGKPMKLKVLAKRSNKEKRLSLSLCQEGNVQCRSGDIQLKHSHGQDGDLDYEFRVVSEQKSGDEKTTNGITFQTKHDGTTRQFEHVAKLIINEEKAEQIGYRIYRTPTGKELGGEILLPTRVIALVATSERPSSGGYQAEIAFYIDKTKKADRKISFEVNATPGTKTADNASTRQVEFVFRHPDLTKNLRVQTRYAYGGESTLVEFETLLDVLQEGSEITTSYAVTKQTVAEGRAYSSVFTILSKGLHLNFGAKGELKYAGRELSYENDITYEDRNREIKTSKVLLQVAAQRFNFEIDGPDSKLVSFISAYEAHPTGGEIKYEIHLPGMEDTRIIKAIANTVSPRNLQFKTYTTNSAQEEFYEVFVGFRSDDELTAGIYDNEPSGRIVLADVSLALNGSRILSVKSNWNKEDLRNVLTKAQERGEKHGARLRDLLTKAIDEVVEESRHIATNIRKAAPSFNVVLTSAREQLTELKQELDQNEDTKLVLDRVKIASHYVKYFTRALLEVARSVRRIVAGYVVGLQEALKELPEKYSKILERIPDYFEALKFLVDRSVDAFISVSRYGAKVLMNGVECLSDSLPRFATVWNWVVDHTEGIVETLSNAVRVGSEKLAKLYTAFRSFLDRVLANRAVREILAEISNRLQLWLADFVEDTKEQAEVIKNYILAAVPQKEFQEFVEAVADYIQKKASRTEVDDAAALRVVYEKLKATIQRAISDIFTLDPEKGIFNARIPLPMSLTSLTKFDQVFSMPSAPKINFRVPAYPYGFREFINQIRSGAAFKELVPPFKGVGLLIGSQFYKTFDGKFYEFEGSCQYILASDFDDGNFTVVVDYHRQGDVSHKSIIVTDGDDTVEVKQDRSVTANGQTIELDNAKTTGNIVIDKVSKWIIIRSKGYLVGCSTTEDVCAVKVDGFYHGKVRGLLGRMNLEKYDDFSKPNGEITPSIQEFTSSWKLNKQCSEPMIFRTMVHTTASAEEKCSRALDSRRSSLRSCYGVVDPTPFRNVCEKLAVRTGFTEEEAVCTAAAAYSMNCFTSHTKVETIPACRG